MDTQVAPFKQPVWPIVQFPLLIIALELLLLVAKTSLPWHVIVVVLSTMAYFFLSRRYLVQLRHESARMHQALVRLEQGNYKPGDTTFLSWLQGAEKHLDSLATTISRQEKALQAEKLTRLRSVIDGQDQERARLSRELHDGLGQSLIAIKLQLENASSLSHSMMRASVDIAQNMIDDTVEEVRRICNALIPAALGEFGLASTLRTRCSEMGALSGFKAQFEVSGALERMDTKTKIYLYRIAQEALNNIAKHAKASEAKMALKREDGKICLEVSDNGKGFIFEPLVFASRNGLQNMRERVHLLNGSFDIDSEPGKGTRIIIYVPYFTHNGKD